MTTTTTTTNESLIDLLTKAWEEAEADRKAHKDPFIETPKVLAARELDQLLADRMELRLKQYNQGLISALEFYALIHEVAQMPVEDGEL